MSTLKYETVTYRHWLPICTKCPNNNLPDLIYISLTFTGAQWIDLYRIRRELKDKFSWRKIYMEDVAKETLDMYPDATVTVRLLFNRHEVSIKNSGFKNAD